MTIITMRRGQSKIISTGDKSPVKIGIHKNMPPGEARDFLPEQHFLLLNISRGDKYVQKRGGRLVENIKPAGEIVLATAGEDSYWRWNWEKTFLQILVKSDFIKTVALECDTKERMIELRDCFGRMDDSLWQIARSLHRETQQPGIGGRLLVESLNHQLAVHLLRDYAVWQPPKTRSYGLSPSVLRKVIELMQERLTESVSLAELAAVADLSSHYFIRQFRTATGLPPYRYFVKLRLEKAKELIETGNLSLSEIAHSTGFSDQPHLTRHFQKHFGLSPGQFGKKTK
ncbi:MAG: AraC family transcriptional regulator [Acidobacteriota bacterium]